TIRIWDAHTGSPVMQPLTGHTGTSVAIPLDEDQLVSRDQTSHTTGPSSNSDSSSTVVDRWELINHTGWISTPQNQLLFWIPPSQR
ncbi:hypothetical protein BJ138DRAFT_1237310, partial [Hygrophoropsis aurantiaca]